MEISLRMLLKSCPRRDSGATHLFSHGAEAPSAEIHPAQQPLRITDTLQTLRKQTLRRVGVPPVISDVMRSDAMLSAERATVLANDSIVDQLTHSLDDFGIVWSRLPGPHQVEVIAPVTAEPKVADAQARVMFREECDQLPARSASKRERATEISKPTTGP